MTGVESAAMSDDLLSRFLRYVRVDTQPDETSNTFPSTPGQLVLLEMLKHELSELGASDCRDDKGRVRHGQHTGQYSQSSCADSSVLRPCGYSAGLLRPQCETYSSSALQWPRDEVPGYSSPNSRSGGVAGASIGARQFLPHAGRRRILDRFRASSS